MSANVETMFHTRTKPWHGLGTIAAEAPDSQEALVLQNFCRVRALSIKM